MKKALIILLVIAITGIILSALIFFINKSLTGNIIKEQDSNASIIINKYSYTKAVCNESNYCQDNEITCQGNKTIKVTPITGAVIQFDDGWQDPRAEGDREKLC